ncbi:MAG: hypothetical protein Q9199_002654 [Rusavskia elegans]
MNNKKDTAYRLPVFKGQIKSKYNNVLKGFEKVFGKRNYQAETKGLLKDQTVVVLSSISVPAGAEDEEDQDEMCKDRCLFPKRKLTGNLFDSMYLVKLLQRRMLSDANEPSSPT